MTVPEAFRGKDGAELVIRLDAPGLGPLEAARKLADLPDAKPARSDLLGRADACAEEGRHDDAVAAFEEAVRAYPDDPGVLNHYAWYLVTTEKGKRDPRRAGTLARKAVDLTKEQDGAILDTLAVALYQDGKLEEAVRYAEMAARQYPDNDVAERARAYRKELEAGTKGGR